MTLGGGHAVLLEALNRHRGKGQQKVTVEHVHVHSGGQAIVGMVEGPALDNSSKPERQPNAKQIAHALQPAMRGPNPEREVVPSASDAERPLPDARRNVTRRRPSSRVFGFPDEPARRQDRGTKIFHRLSLQVARSRMIPQ